MFPLATLNPKYTQVPFPGAGDNLKGIFNKTVGISKDVMCSPESYPATKRFLICFLLLVDKLSGPVSMSEVGYHVTSSSFYCISADLEIERSLTPPFLINLQRTGTIDFKEFS